MSGKARGKLWNKLFRQAIPFFTMLYMAFAIIWISADYLLAFVNKMPVGELSVQLAIGIPIAIVAMVISTAFDHWLQDHYQVDKEGNPRAKEQKENHS